ncbi:OmpA family protein [Lysobacter rhizosphaerae]
MLGTRIVINRGGRDEEEKPFWISFADLMTALMVLFLVVMGVALLAVTRKVSERERQEQERNRNIEILLNRFEQAAQRYPGITVDRERGVIDFGSRAQFDFASSALAPERGAFLRSFVPEILERANDRIGRSVLKRIVVEGYTDRTGSYLSNLNLSLQRSQRVLCAMFAPSGDHLLSDLQKTEVRDLFLVGGYSFNASKKTPEESRRVEMRLEFLGLGEQRGTAAEDDRNFGSCSL